MVVSAVNLFISRNQTKAQHVFYSVAYLNRIAGMIAPKDEQVRLMLLKIYFGLFRRILGNEERGVSGY